MIGGEALVRSLVASGVDVVLADPGVREGDGGDPVVRRQRNGGHDRGTEARGYEREDAVHLPALAHQMRFRSRGAAGRHSP